MFGNFADDKTVFVNHLSVWCSFILSPVLGSHKIEGHNGEQRVLHHRYSSQLINLGNGCSASQERFLVRHHSCIIYSVFHQPGKILYVRYHSCVICGCILPARKDSV
jgi:hypothetical protein